MFDKGSSDGSHQIAAQKAELGLGSFSFKAAIKFEACRSPEASPAIR